MITTRFAPSPTGFLHVGGARTAIFSWLAARAQKGQFRLRIEDTDQKRHVPEAVDAILEGLNWLGLDWDGPVVFQSERNERYQEVLRQLEEAGALYRCDCSQDRLESLKQEQMEKGQTACYDRRCREKSPTSQIVKPYVLRFKTPLTGEVVIQDLIRGNITIQNKSLDDWIVARSDGSATYNFCVVIDDLDAKVSHIVRGEEHLNNTPKQINLLKALYQPLPTYAHVGVILDQDGKKLSKRLGASNLLQYREEGYLPEALMNYLVRLGWAFGDQELLSRDSLLEHFSLSNVRAAPSCFDLEKLRWLNQQYLLQTSDEALVSLVESQLKKRNLVPPFEICLEKMIGLYKPRSMTLFELVNQARVLWAPYNISDDQISCYFSSSVQVALRALLMQFKLLTEWESVTIRVVLKSVVKEYSLRFSELAIPLRLCLLGIESSPNIDSICALLPKERVLDRIQTQLDLMQ